jgi:hypothetical protein
MELRIVREKTRLTSRPKMSVLLWFGMVGFAYHCTWGKKVDSVRRWLRGASMAKIWRTVNFPPGSGKASNVGGESFGGWQALSVQPAVESIWLPVSAQSQAGTLTVEHWAQVWARAAGVDAMDTASTARHPSAALLMEDPSWKGLQILRGF